MKHRRETTQDAKGRRDMSWQCDFCGCNNASGKHVCLLCKLKRVDTSGLSAQTVMRRHGKKLTAADIARVLLHDDAKDYAVGYDMQLGIDLARAVLKEERTHKQERCYAVVITRVLVKGGWAEDAAFCAVAKSRHAQCDHTFVTFDEMILRLRRAAK